MVRSGRIGNLDRLEIARFLEMYPGMSLAPTRNSDIVLKGKFEFKGDPPDLPSIEDAYQLKFRIPSAYPREMPLVEEIGDRITRVPDNHVSSDGSLCLGSELRLLWIISSCPSLQLYVDRCLVPFLYAFSHKERYGGDLVFDELDHNYEAIADDYIELFGLSTRSQVIRTLQLLGMKKRLANKERCPCGCEKRLGKCQFNERIHEFRTLAPASTFRQHQLLLVNKLNSRSVPQMKSYSNLGTL